MKDRKVLAARYSSHGPAEEVLELQSMSLPEPKRGQVWVRLLAASINPSDIGTIQGSYGRLKELPATAGREGVGEVIALGEGTEGPPLGTWVRMPEDSVWQEVSLASAGELLVLPKGISREMGAMAFINPPTVWRLLHDFVTLQKGDWIVQNAASSALGFFVVQLAKHFGFRTINVVRDLSWKASLEGVGADIVVEENSDYPKKIRELTGGVLPVLGFNSVGGKSVMDLIKCMKEGGTVVTFGGMVGDLVRFPTRFLIFNDVRLRGFWLDRWMRRHSLCEVKVLFEEVFSLMKQGVIKAAPVDRVFPLEEVVEAVRYAKQGRRKGKVLLKTD